METSTASSKRLLLRGRMIDKEINPIDSQFLIYQNQEGDVKIDVRFQDETIWLSLDQMATLFSRDKSTISRHIKSIFEEGELYRNSVVANFATTATDGKNYQVEYYNLDVIISVGYRVKSQQIHRKISSRV